MQRQSALFPGQPCPSCNGKATDASRAAFLAVRPNRLLRPGFEECAHCGAIAKVALVRPASRYEALVARGENPAPRVAFDVDGTLIVYDGEVDWDDLDAVAASGRPHLLALAQVKALMDSGVNVVFLTSRRAHLGQLTRTQLADRLGVSPGTLALYVNHHPTYDVQLALLAKVDALQATMCDVYVGDLDIDQTAAAATGTPFVPAATLQVGNDVLEAAGIAWPSPSSTTTTTGTLRGADTVTGADDQAHLHARRPDNEEGEPAGIPAGGLL